jgi:Membrane-associated phospholipid phosphatase
MHKIIEFDKELFLTINNKHVEWLDPIMVFFSSYYSWAAIALLLLAYIVKNGEKKWTLGIFTILTALSTNLTNLLIKTIIARPRPIHEPDFIDIIHSPERYDASYSFFSAHSSTSFSLALFTVLVVSNKYVKALAITWASIVAYSRIYLGKHYPLDVITGILFGVMMAVVWKRIYDGTVNILEKPH